MNRYLKLTLVWFFCAMSFNIAQAQTETQPEKKDTVNVGTVTGILRDSLHNYVLPSATIAIYKIKDNELINYQLTNNFGRYQFKNVPVGIPLHAIITHVGYQSTKREFTVPADTKTLDLKATNMQRLDLSIKEVTITAVQTPMQVHGDTLEFNAAAFKLDSTAVVGDFLRKLPGVTVWADGVITVNGKKINSLLVEGKSMFNGDNKIILDNIPKDAVQKVQVYRNKEDKDPVNPKTDMNIVLKKNKKDGMFGKFGVGYGTHDHYAGDGMLTYYSPKTQVSVVGAYNNVNKTAGNVNELMEFNSFKGEGINNDYHSDFQKAGLNVFRGGGATFSQDFSKDSDPRQAYFKTNLLKGEVFSRGGSNKTVRESNTYISLGDAGKQTQQSIQNSTSDYFNLTSNANYEKRWQYYSLKASVRNDKSHSTSQNDSKTLTFNDQTGDKSQDVENSKGKSSSSNTGGSIELNSDRRFDFSKGRYKSAYAQFKYEFEVNHGNDANNNLVDFTSTQAAQNRFLHRNYLKDWNSNTHTFSANLRDGLAMLFRGNQFLHIDAFNSISFYHNNENNDVSDLPANSSFYVPNTNLTNISHYRTIDEKPGLNFYKYVTHSLDNRYYHGWNFSAVAQAHIFSQKNEALQTIQNLQRSYSYFIPSANITYYDEEYGDFTKSYRFGYNTSVNYPGMDQLAPLVDDANIYSKTLPNLGLKPSYKHEMSFNYDLYGQKKKNPATYSLWIAGSLTRHNIADSVLYDDLSRAIHRFINTSDARTFDFNNTYRKAFNFKDHQLQFEGNGWVKYSEYTSAVDTRNYLTQASSLGGSGKLTYSYKTIWTAGLGEYFSGSKTHQGDLSHYTNYNWSTVGDIAFALPKSFFFNTRVNFNNNKTSAVDHNVYYTIWNADFGYRFLKGSRGEIKISALDILHQNKSIENYIGTNQLTTTNTNVLQQYFMLTLAYYPRSFGLHKKKGD